MTIETTRDYHVRRATAELHLAYAAEGWAAAEAHLRLSALHMARLRDETRGIGDELSRPN